MSQVDLRITLSGKGGDPDTVSSDQTVRLSHEDGSMLLASIHNEKYFGAERAGASWIRGIKEEFALSHLWLAVEYKAGPYMGGDLPLSLAMASVICAEVMGTAFGIWTVSGLDAKRMGYLNSIYLDHASRDRVVLSAQKDIEFIDPDHGRKHSGHLSAYRLKQGSMNPDFVSMVEKRLRRAISDASGDVAKDTLRWTEMPLVWQRWLASDSFAHFSGESPFAYHIRQANGLTVKEVSTPGWAPPAQLKISRKLAENLLLDDTLRLSGIVPSESMRWRLRQAVESAKVDGSEDLIKLSVDPNLQSDHLHPERTQRPHLLAFVARLVGVLGLPSSGRQT